jgi:AcrR family transcriptional regulator
MRNDVRHGPSDAGVVAIRRAPFSDNPHVGPRGQRTQQRILDAALQAFGERGYHGCSVDRIAKLARCSRVSFYQYFASKDDVFRHLARQVARQVRASTEALDPLTSDSGGWEALRAWVARYAEIHARYEPVFHVLVGDEALAAVAGRTGEETVLRIHARLASATLPSRQLDPVINLLLECVNHTLDIAGILRSVVGHAYPTERMEIALTDVLHRTLFGADANVNLHPAEGARPPTLDPSPEMLELLGYDEVSKRDASVNHALEALLTSSHDVFVARGYHDTRVDDLVAAAGVSHGAFYRYFRNKDQLARLLTARALRDIGEAVVEMPTVSALDGASGTARLRRWLRRYHAAHVNEAAMLRVWLDAAR